MGRHGRGRPGTDELGHIQRLVKPPHPPPPFTTATSPPPTVAPWLSEDKTLNAIPDLHGRMGMGVGVA